MWEMRPAFRLGRFQEGSDLGNGRLVLPKGEEMKQTQCEAILAYLRKHKRATNMELTQKLWIACPHKRIAELDESVLVWRNGRGPIRIERITRSFIKTPSGKRVVQYRLERV